jgi:hypothetical protein
VVAILGLVMAAVSGQGAAAQEQPTTSRPADPAEMKRFLFAGLAERVAGLQSASYTATGRMSGRLTSSAFKAPEGELRISGAFDAERMRMDVRQPAYIETPESIAERLRESGRAAARPLAPPTPAERKPPNSNQVVLTDIETYFIRTPQKTIFWYNGLPTVYVMAGNEKVPSHVMHFDINALGLYGWLEINRGTPANELLAAFEARDPYRVDELPGDVWRLSFPHDHRISHSEWQIDIDVGHGFTPVESRMIEVANVGPHKGQQRTTQLSRVSWIQQGTAWVPVQFHIENGATDADSTSAIDLTFTFDSVNQPLSAQRFSYESIPAPNFAAIVDSSGAKPVVIRPHFQGVEPPAKPRSEFSPPSRPLTSVIIVINVLVLAIIGVIYYIRRRHGRNETPTARQ